MITGVNHITLAVKNIEISFDFYSNILGFKPLCKWHTGAYLLAGNIWFCIHHDAAYQATTGYSHVAFDVDTDDFEQLKEKIIMNNISIFKENKSEGNSVYFLDPDGHKLEIHLGSWKTRIASKKRNTGSWQNVEFFI